MNTTESAPVFRDDGELLGYVIRSGPHLWVPSTVFGHPLDEPVSRGEAEAYLHAHGLSHLAEKWVYLSDDDQRITVQIVEAGPSRVTIRFIDYGHPELFGSTRDLRTPLAGVLDLAENKSRLR